MTDLEPLRWSVVELRRSGALVFPEDPLDRVGDLLEDARTEEEQIP